MSGEALRLAALGFGVDRVTAEVTEALGAAGIPSVLVKGPAIATWLYAGEEGRLYGDTDLLLRAADWEAATRLLGGLGFLDDLGPLGHPRMESGLGHPWTRPADGAAVDLHLSFFGIGADPDLVWSAFSAGAERRAVGGAIVRMPSHPARALHVCLHAVQHGGHPGTKSVADLERALERLPEGTWREAAALAERLDAAEGFAAGLGLLPAGRELGRRIGARQGRSPGSALRLEGVPMAEGFGELAASDGARAKLGLLLRELFPRPEFLRWWMPLARRGRRGLALAYLWRPLWLAWHALPGYLAWRRARGLPGGERR